MLYQSLGCVHHSVVWLPVLPQEQLVQREHRKETRRSRKREAAMLDKAGLNPQGLTPEEEEEEALAKGVVISYCALDYPRLVDMLRYRLAMMQRHVKVGCLYIKNRD